MTLGDIVLKYREDHHLSQRQFAMKCGVSNGYISMIENNENPSTGKPVAVGISIIKSIASAMGMTVHELMGMCDGDTIVSLKSEEMEPSPQLPGAVKLLSLAHAYPDMSPQMRAYVDGSLDFLFKQLEDQFKKGRSADDSKL